MDNKVLEKRLLYRESSIGLQASVNKCAKTFSDLMYIGTSAEDASLKLKTIETLIRDIKAYQFDMIKVADSTRVCQEEIDEYIRQEKLLQADQEDVQLNLLKLTNDLDEEQQLRAARAECETSAKHVNTLPTQDTLKRQIDDARTRLAATNELISEADEKIKKRLRVLGDIEGLIDFLKVRLPLEENPAADLAAEEETEGEIGRDDDAVVGQAVSDLPESTKEEDNDGEEVVEEEEEAETDAADVNDDTVVAVADMTLTAEDEQEHQVDSINMTTVLMEVNEELSQ